VYKSGPKKGQQGHKAQQYYPLHPPATSLAARRRTLQSFRTDVDNLPLRTTQGYIQDGTASFNDKRLAINSGVKAVSPLCHLPTISIADSVPFDQMHLLFEGLVKDLCAFLGGTYFKSANLNDPNPTGIKPGCWAELGVDMENIDAPVSFGKNPRNIEKDLHDFKADELSNFLLHFLLPLSFDRVSTSTYKALQSLVLATSLAVGYEVTYSEIAEIEDHLTRFAKWYYDTLYGQEYERLPACKYTIHCMLHLPRDLRNWGSASYFWQFAAV
jgi:hypothetical protein